MNFFNLDNLELMRRYADSHFDLAIVDPPYGIGETWSKSKTDQFYHKGKLHSYENKDIPPKEYFDELFRVSKNQIIWGGNYFTEFLPPTNAWIIWDKIKSNNVFMSDGEMAWTSFSKPVRFARFMWDGGRKCETIKKWHPHQKPVKLYEWLLKKYAKPGDRILDTHLGSASIAIAVARVNAIDSMGLEFTGCEIDKKYFKKSMKIINQLNNQVLLSL